MSELYEMSGLELGRLIQSKEASSEEVVQSFIERVEKTEPQTKSFITFCPEEALIEARQVDKLLLEGAEMHPLAGVPIAVKDNISTRGVKTTCGSKILQNYVPQYDSTAVARLREAKMPILGKTNMDEFAMGSSTENSAFFPTHNPWDINRVPGGSSGGSASAVAMRQAPMALGSDTGGSVRQPASFCGVQGLRPTYGRVSRYGLVAFASSLDQIGTFARDSLDSWALFSLIAGHDRRDSTSLNTPLPEEPDILNKETVLQGLRVGVIEVSTADGFQTTVIDKNREIADYMAAKGSNVENVKLPLTDYALSAYYIINPAEVSSNLGRYDGIRYGYSLEVDDDNPLNGIKDYFSRVRGEGFGEEAKRRIMLGTYALSAGYYDAYYLQAIKVRTLIKQELEEAFQKYDLLLGPITPTPAFFLGEKSKDPLQMYLSDVCTISAALAGYPALSFPCGLSDERLPLGIQFTAPPLQELLLFQVANALGEKELQDKPPEPAVKRQQGGGVGSEL